MSEVEFYKKMAERAVSALTEIFFEKYQRVEDDDTADEDTDEAVGEVLGVGPYVVADLQFGEYDAYEDYCSYESEDD